MVKRGPTPKKKVLPRKVKHPRNPINQATIWPEHGRKTNWTLLKLKAKPGSDVEWFCGKLDFKIWFPDNRNPLVGTNQVTGVDGYAKAQVRPDVIAKEHYFYCVLATDPKGHAHLAMGNSPPDMEIV
jgi:hypothetical protein